LGTSGDSLQGTDDGSAEPSFGDRSAKFTSGGIWRFSGNRFNGLKE
jgi:hypothetical protein